MNGIGNVIVADGSKSGHKHGKAVAVIIAIMKVVIAWRVVQGGEGDGIAATDGSELYLHVHSGNVNTRVEFDVKFQADDVSYDGRVW